MSRPYVLPVALTAAGNLGFMEHPGTIVKSIAPVFTTGAGSLFNCDALALLRSLPTASISLIFSDPPFNCGKEYGSGINDSLSELEYERWLQNWLFECIRVLVPGGALLVYHVPRFAFKIAAFLDGAGMTHCANIVHKRTDGAPRRRRLKSSHYEIVYFTAGSPLFFQTPRRQLETCDRCAFPAKNYGGKASLLNPAGLDVGDVWDDIPQVSSTKNKNRLANELNILLLDRIISMTTRPGELILDPFGGSGTTFAAAELRGRRWLGSELGSCEPIITRLSDLSRDRQILERADAAAGTLLSQETREKMESNGIRHDKFPRR